MIAKAAAEPACMGWIQTYTGRKVNPLAMELGDLHILDIAHALSMRARFSGHTRLLHSVAHHSVIVSQIVSPQAALWGLLHDAAEAYLPDIVRPIKHRIGPVLLRAENKILALVAKKFGLKPRLIPAEVHEADQIVLATEARDLFLGGTSGWGLNTRPLPAPIEPVAPKIAERMFLLRFKQLLSGLPESSENGHDDED